MTDADARRGTAGSVTTESLSLREPLLLECGRELEEVVVAYETYGDLAPEADNAVLICHALSGDAHAAGWAAVDTGTPSAVDGIGAEEQGVADERRLGWWDSMIGPGKAFDTDELFVVCPNLLGGCRGTTGPPSLDPATGAPYGATFPAVTVGDMIELQRRFLHELGTDRLLCAAGPSLGGMQALQWTIDFPDQIDLCVAIAATAGLSARGLALNAVARNAITADPGWRGGDARAGLALARQIGHITYVSGETLERKFGRRLQDRDEPSYTLDEPDFAIESYLARQGERFVQRFDANTYLAMSRALTYFDLARTHGGGSLPHAFAPAQAAFLLLSFTSDWLYEPADSERLAAALTAAGKEVVHVCIEDDYGHDAFLLDAEGQAPHIRRALAHALAERRSG